jgi:hypothetical protein
MIACHFHPCSPFVPLPPRSPFTPAPPHEWRSSWLLPPQKTGFFVFRSVFETCVETHSPQIAQVTIAEATTPDMPAKRKRSGGKPGADAAGDVPQRKPDACRDDLTSSCAVQVASDRLLELQQLPDPNVREVTLLDTQTNATVLFRQKEGFQTHQTILANNQQVLSLLEGLVTNAISTVCSGDCASVVLHNADLAAHPGERRCCPK